LYIHQFKLTSEKKVYDLNITRIYTLFFSCASTVLHSVSLALFT
jgi:hypothetical protein